MAAKMDPRTRALLEAPMARTLLRLAVPNILVLGAQAAAGLIETYFIGKLGTESLAGVALVFPVVMLMQMMSAGAMGGGISSAIARALGGSRGAEANALVLQAVMIAVVFGATFMLAVLGGGRWLYGAMGAEGPSMDAALTYSNWVFAGAVLIWLFNSLAAVIRGRSRHSGSPAALWHCWPFTSLGPASYGRICGQARASCTRPFEA
jgi:Na+-driven multidrug efflux pump